MSTTSSTAALYFTGISSYSSDFQSILQREVSIAQLPVQALQNQQTDNLNKKQALIALDPVVANLATAISSLGSIASGQGLTVNSDSNSVSVVNTGVTGPGTYTLTNVQVASAASETSLQAYADATTTPFWVAGQNKFDLVAGGNTYHLDLTGNNNLTALADAINNSGAPVNASIINSGSNSYLAISANNVGATTLTLSAVPQSVSLITSNGTGTESSLYGYANSGSTNVSNSGHVDLTVGSGDTVHLDISANNNLTGLMNAINGAGAGVTASITSSGGKNYLQITSDGDPAAITLTDTAGASPVNLISAANQGSDASFTLNGSIPVKQSTNVFSNVIPGISFTLQNDDAGPVTLSVATDSSQLVNALQTFMTNYNALVDQVAQQTGQGAGALAGDTLIRNISDDLRQLSSYSNRGSSSVQSLYDLGLTFDTSGHLSFDSSVVQSFSSTQIADTFKYLSSTSGLASYAQNFTQLSDPLTGMIKIQEDGYDSENAQISDQVTTLNARISQTQAAMTAKLQAADALVAQLESDQNTVNAEIQSINYVTYGKLVNQNSGQ